MSDMYVLHHRKPVVCDDMVKWSRFFSKHKRHIRKTVLDSHLVSTVFLGIDHDFSGKAPELFETMIFDNKKNDVYMRRCSTHRQALAMHWQAVEWIKTHSVEYE